MSMPTFRGAFRGIDARLLAAKASLFPTQAQRELLWFLQGLSMDPGGLERTASALVEMFPDRTAPGKLYSEDPDTGEEIEVAAGAAYLRDHREQLGAELADFLTALCVKDGILFPPPGGTEADRASTFEHAERAFRQAGMPCMPFVDAALPGFDGVIEALYRFKERYTEQVLAGFYVTENGRTIFDAIAWATDAKRMVLIDGREGRGKSAAVQAWCAANPGRARYANVSGSTGKTQFFRAIARAIGVPHSDKLAPVTLQTRIEDVLQGAGLALIIDEAHFALPQGPKIWSRPELIDWIDTSLCNHKVPVALVTTPQFGRQLSQVVDQTGWNVGQFRRRVRWITLKENTSVQDLAGVARTLVPTIDEPSLDLCLGYAKGLANRDISGLVDLVEAATLIARSEARSVPAGRDFNASMDDICLPSDSASIAAVPCFDVRADGSGRSPKAEPQPATPPSGDSAPLMVQRPIRGAAAPLQGCRRGKTISSRTVEPVPDREAIPAL